MRLFDVDRGPRWTGETLPVLFEGPLSCARCGFGVVVRLAPFVEDALFRHGGYGESLRRTVSVCLACGRSSEVARESVRPL